MIQKAIIVSDMLNDFVIDGAPLQVPGAQNIIPNIQREMEKARREGTPVFYLCDSHAPGDPELAVWPPHAMKGTRGAEIVEELAPREGDVVIEKTRYDGFYLTDLEEQLRARGVSELILTGVCTEICVHYTGASALMRGFKVTVPDDCVQGLSAENAKSALNMLMRVLQPMG
ncbi:MAG: isochorismatase family cysteine hydrolase [Candidatus Omnitrophota bacterium]